jgi:DNA-binding transcriptional regulator YiaG
MNAVDEALQLTRVRALFSSGAARALRVAAGLSLPEGAKAGRVAVSTLWRWEEGQRVPHGEAALRYGELLDALAQAGPGRRSRKVAAS